MARNLRRDYDMRDRSRRCRDRVFGDIGRGNRVNGESVGLRRSFDRRGMFMNCGEALGRRGSDLDIRLAICAMLLAWWSQSDERSDREVLTGDVLGRSI